MDVRVLGPLEIRDGQRLLEPKRRLCRILLGMLALKANMPLSAESIVDAIWAGNSPQSAPANLRSYVAELRRLLAGDGATGPRIEAVRSGYLLRVGTTNLDVLGFEALAEQGRCLLRDGDAGLAADRLTRALSLWRGPVLAGLSVPQVLIQEARLLEEARLDVVEDSVDARLALGRHRELASELSMLVGEHGFRERLWGQLMLAQFRSGRQTEALGTYQRLYRLLADELGVVPGQAIQDLHVRMLRSDPDLRLREIIAAGRAVPWQLPPISGTFLGRESELSTMDEFLAPAIHGPVVVGLLTGTAGVGKTTLALRWAHRVRDRFPDGCLYADLRGYGPDQPRTPDDVLAEFLRTLGVQPEEPLIGKYRSAITGRRMLVVLDNAYSAEQVRPLLPGDSCGILVTSRDALTGLVARDGALRVDVGLLSHVDADSLLRTLIGQRADAEPGTTSVLAQRCARLPLALRIAAELVAGQSSMTLATLAGELADEQGRLDTLDVGGDVHSAMRSVLSWSIRHLTDREARAWRLLGLHPGRHVDTYAVAALADEPARPLISGLLRSHLIQEVGPGRYSSHDLLRDYARELACAIPEVDRRAAMARLLDQQTYAASLAMDMLYPYEAHRRPKTVASATPSPVFDSPDSARAWLDGELANLLALLRLAAEQGWTAHVGILAGTLHRHLHTHGRYMEMRIAHELALAAAREHHHDRRAEAAARHDLGMTMLRLGHNDQALDQLTRALCLQVDESDHIGESGTLYGLGMIHYQQGRLPEALEHFERALWLNRHLGDRSAEGAVLGRIGLVHEWLGRWAQALEFYHRALDIHRDTGSRAGEGDTLNNMGIAHRQTGDYPAAVRHLEQALVVYREIGDRGGDGAALNNLGLIYTSQQDWARARQHLEAALTVHREIHSAVAEMETLNILGVLDYRSGNPIEAIARFRGTLAQSIDLEVPGAEMNAHYGLGQALHRSGQPDGALTHFESALDLARATGARSAEADALMGVSRCLADLHQTADSGDFRRQALALYHELGISAVDRF